MHKIIISLILLLLIVTVYLNTNGYNSNKEGFHSDFLFTAYNQKMVCSKWLDNLPKHMRISHSGSPMYTSHFPPSDRFFI